MSPAKVTLSPKERDLVRNKDWILTKNDIITKVYTVFGDLSNRYHACLQQYPDIQTEGSGFRSPKIARGEQYRGLPWVMLDYPRYFSGSDHFAVRSFFWWGNDASITLQLAGSFQQKYAGALQAYFSNPIPVANNSGPWWLGTGEGPWGHHFEENNYRVLETPNRESFARMPYIKLAKKIALDKWDEWPVFFSAVFTEMLDILQTEID